MVKSLKWTANRGWQRCAVGWLHTLGSDHFYHEKLVCRLQSLFGQHLNAGVAAVNDGEIKTFNQKTPKQRILAALREIEKKEGSLNEHG